MISQSFAVELSYPTEQGLRVINSLVYTKDYSTKVLLGVNQGKKDTLKEVLLVLVALGENYNANSYLYKLLPVEEVDKYFHQVSGSRFVIDPYESDELIKYINTL
jgi:hypothetical protein